jgi:hypothetical protein
VFQHRLVSRAELKSPHHPSSRFCPWLRVSPAITTLKSVSVPKQISPKKNFMFCKS